MGSANSTDGILARSQCSRIICLCVAKFDDTTGANDALAAALLDSVAKFDHMVSLVAEICAKAETRLISKVTFSKLTNIYN
jgi:hypothetical protein